MTTSKTWGDYEVFFEQTLGRGGMGAVYKGRQISVNRPVAVKILKRDLTESPDFVRRFYREATLLAKLVDNHIVQIFGAGEAEGQHFYAMELVEGEDLASRLRRGYQFPTQEILQIALQTASALEVAWKEKIIHRDIKPSNILITKEGVVKVMDFGLAKNPENDLTQTEMIMGTAKYMSPEQATGGRCDIRSDLYSLGAVLYELATGTAPFVGESPTAVIYQHVHKAPVPPQKLNPSIPASLQSSVLRLLAKNADDRYQTPEDLAKDCKAILEGVSLDEKTVLYSETASSRMQETIGVTAEIPPQPSRMGVYLSVLVVVAALAGGGYLVVRALQNSPTTNGNGPPPPPNGDPAKEKEIKGAIEEADKAWRNKKWQDAVRHYEKAQSLIGESDPRRAEIGRKLTGAQFEYAHEEGDVAYGERKWEQAIRHFEKALSLLPETDSRRGEVVQEIQSARFNQRLDDARKESDLRQKIRLLEQAVELAVTKQDRELANSLLRATLVKKAVQEAREKEGADWGGAAASWKEAARNEDDAADRAKFEKKEKFCGGMAELLRLKREEKWDEVIQKIDELLLLEPGAFEQGLHDEKKAAERALVEARRMRFGELLQEARRHLDRFEWEHAEPRLKEAAGELFVPYRNEEFRALQDLLDRWTRRPAGTVFLPSRKYGGATELPAFYLDEKEVTVDEYKAFLAALPAGASHLATCPCGPTDPDHIPDRFESQKGPDPVRGVNALDAAAYAAWKGKEWRLPTAEESEAAAAWDPKSGSRRKYPWGPAFGTGTGESALGLKGFDNGILEWTKTGGAKSGESVLRGGYRLEAERETQLQTTYRYERARNKKDLGFGFRCLKEP